MAVLKTISENQLDSLRPEVSEAYTKLSEAIRSRMRLRRYELITFASTLALKCTHWTLIHGALLRKNFFSVDQLAAITKDFRNAGLHPQEVAMMSFAQKVITQAYQVSEYDIDQLHAVGLSDEEILDIVLTCAARSFIGITLDALGAEPNIAEMDLEPELIQLLAVGRPFSKWEQTEQ